MARESKATRDERRFGRPERLADAIEFGDERPFVVEASNVGAYYAEFMDKNRSLSFENDLPHVKLPFSACFVEMWHPVLKMLVGWGFYDHPTDDVVMHGKTWLDEKEVEITYPPSFAILGRMFLGHRMPLRVHGPICNTMIATDEHGKLIANPQFEILMEKLKTAEYGVRFMQETLCPCLLALCFMHCRNVARVEHQPDRQVNRERRKAGLKPFVRYHTINIEPMKRVLRTEGNVESEGLKRALHICRGHFSTYSEERPLFGKVAGTFWVPAHVRGSSKEGVVFSDYRVGAPK